MKETENTTHEFGFVVFIDPMYKQGWQERANLPEDKDAIHIGIGVIIKETKRSVTFAFAEELHDKSSDVMHPQLIHRDCIIKLYRFTEDFIYEIFKGKTAKRIRSKIRRDIDYKISDFCEEE
jgi:hypothetical protein